VRDRCTTGRNPKVRMSVMRKNGAGYESIKSNEAAITALEGEPDEAKPRSSSRFAFGENNQFRLASSNFAGSR